MEFAKRLREGVRRGRIRCSIRLWKGLHVKVGGRYRMDQGHIVVDAIATIEKSDITDELARESGFSGVEDLLQTASHGGGQNVYLIRFHYLPPGAWDVAPPEETPSHNRPTLLERIRSTRAPALRAKRKKRATRRSGKA